ncbi:MAG: prepilin peptidase [Cyanobacteria bacterium SIG31]|nr:prepilin peptidase [Cyanobacteria bacterium SIG31]
MDSLLYNYLLFWICILGACLGSFYNVVIIRSLSGESIVLPASKCPICGQKLKYWHNIPILSYLFLQGKCAFCKEKISIQYPIIEALTMGLFAFSFIKFGQSWATIFAMILSSCLLIMSTTDIKEKLVDCNIAIGLAVCGITYNWLINHTVLDSIYGILLGILTMEILARLGYLFKKGRAFGEADTYIAGALGACFGLSGITHILIYTLITSALFIIPIFLYQQIKNNNKSLSIFFILFIISVLVHKTICQSWYSFIAIICLGCILIYKILGNLKNDSEPLYFPLVPAFSIATLYFLFF